MSQRAVRKEIEEYSDDELARLLESKGEEVSEAVDGLNAALRVADEVPTDDQVTELWEAVDALDAAARSLTTRTVEAHDES